MYQLWTLFWRVYVQDSNSVFWWYWCNSCWSHGSCTVFCLCDKGHPWRRIDRIYACVKGGFATNKSEFVAAYAASHYVVILMKTATQRRPPPLDLCSFGLDMKGRILELAISHAPTGPDALIDAITCGCVTQGKACSTQYSYYHHHITCMMVCKCAWSDMCRNPLKQRSGRRKVKLKTN